MICALAYEGKNWLECVPMVEFVVNSAVAEATSMLPVLGSVHVLVMFCYSSQLVVLVCAGCSGFALQLVMFTMSFVLYSGICMSICPLVAMYVEFLASRLA